MIGHDGSISLGRKLNFGLRGYPWWLLWKPFAAGEQRHPPDVRRRVVEVPVADVVAQTVDRRRQHEHVHEQVNAGGQQPPPEAQHVAEPDDAEHRSGEAEAEHHAVEYVLFDVPRVALERLGILRFLEVVEDVAELHGPEAAQVRAVRIALRFL